MRLIGADAEGDQLVDLELPHGGVPAVSLWDAGFRLLRPIRARRRDGDIAIDLLVEPRGDTPRPHQPPRGQDRGLVLSPGEAPTIRQRVAAYAIVTSVRGLLITQFSARTAVEGRWGLPGGGIDDGEDPEDAVLREVDEETSQHIELGDLVQLQTSHWIGRNPRGLIEDFQAVRLVYRAGCPDPTDPVIRDVGGTTSQARWVELDDWRSVNWTHGWRELLAELL